MILTFYSLQALITSLASFVVGFFVFSKNRKGLVNRTFALWTLTVAIWAFGISIHAVTKDASSGLIWSRILHGAAIWIPTFFLHFIFALLNLRNRKWILWLSYLSSGIFFIFNFTDLFIRGVRQVLNFKYFPAPGPIYPLFILMFVMCVIYSLCNMYNTIKASSGNKRNQIRYVFWGSVIGFTGGSTTFLPVFNIKVFPIGNFFIFLYILLIAYSIIKYHLMDIKVALTRAGIIFLVYMLVLGIPFWLGFNVLGKGFWIIPVLLMGMFATAGPFIYSYLRRRAENILLREQKRYQQALRDFSSTLIFIRETEELFEKVTAKVMDLVNLDFSAVYLKENVSFSLKSKKVKGNPNLPSKIEADSRFVSYLNSSQSVLGDYLPSLGSGLKIGLACPLFLNRQLAGFVLLGTKQEGKIFTDTDMDAFSIVSAQVSLALSEIYYFKEYQKATEQKHKLELEKTRLEGAFQIAEAYRHELGNIINIISMSLMNLSSIGGYEPTKEDIEMTRVSISKNVKRAKYIFNAVGKYNENANLSFQPQRLDKLISAALEEHKESISKQNIKLDLKLEKDIKIEANNNLPAALNYLIKGAMTAIEYIKPEEKLIKIRLTNQNNKVFLKVSDTGGDIKENKLYKGIGIERGKEGGILYFLARRIIFDHQGSFQISSFEDKKGTTFSIELPLQKD